jgi:hypothetical protein
MKLRKHRNSLIITIAVRITLQNAIQSSVWMEGMLWICSLGLTAGLTYHKKKFQKQNYLCSFRTSVKVRSCSGATPYCQEIHDTLFSCNSGFFA